MTAPLRPPAAGFDAQLSVARAENDLLFTDDGQAYIDLFAGAGTVFLGHLNPGITAAIQEQLGKVWITGAVPTAVRTEAHALVDGFFPSTHSLAGLYSTGMEVAEFALRLARVVTGRRGVVGFDRCMHGKSTATAYLGWPNDQVRLPDSCRLPYVPTWSEERILDRLGSLLAEETISAVFIEPLQSSGGGHLASAAFFEEVARLCTAHGSLLALDEICTGFHRTGAPFLYHTLGVIPDIVLIGKAMGNGFPVSGVVVNNRYRIEPEMLPGSTFTGNALAAAAVAATLRQMQTMPMSSLVSSIEVTISTTLAPLVEAGISMRGRGALWILEFPSHVSAQQVAEQVFAGGVAVSVVGPYIRLLPAATISQDRLIEACAVVRNACLAPSGDYPRGE